MRSSQFGHEESRFVRRPVPITRDFGTYRNWWVRNARMAGNPLSIYLYLLSHDESFEVTPRKVMHDLGLGRTAFTSARKVLEQMGFLRTEIVRQPSGARDEVGNSIAGQVIRTDFILDDPLPPVVRPVETQVAGFVHQPADAPELVAEIAVIAADARNLTPGDLQSGNLASGSVPLKEDQHQEKQDQENNDDDDARGLELDFRAIDPRLTVGRLTRALARFAPDVAFESVVAVGAAREILRRADHLVGDPNAYVARSIAREPDRWLARPIQPGGTHSRATCAEAGHRFVGEWREFCSRCDSERPGWRDDRDNAMRGRSA